VYTIVSKERSSTILTSFFVFLRERTKSFMRINSIHISFRMPSKISSWKETNWTSAVRCNESWEEKHPHKKKDLKINRKFWERTKPPKSSLVLVDQNWRNILEISENETRGNERPIEVRSTPDLTRQQQHTGARVFSLKNISLKNHPRRARAALQYSRVHHRVRRGSKHAARTEIQCLAVDKARMNSTVPCTPILAIRSRIDGPDDMNSQVLQGPSTVYAVQWFMYSASATVQCAVHRLQYLILTVYFQSDDPRCKARYCSSVPCPQQGTGSQSTRHMGVAGPTPRGTEKIKAGERDREFSVWKGTGPESRTTTIPPHEPRA
jgi:hypothetical protein